MIGLGLFLWLALLKAETLRPPPGFVFLADDDGALLTDDDGAYLIEPI